MRGVLVSYYVFVRRKGYGAEEAEDLTQTFFVQLIAKEHLRLADRSKGKFRTFLLTMLDYFLAREWSRAHRQKRGGQFKFVSLDQESPEERYRLEPADRATPETTFLRQWALAVLEQAMNILEQECRAQDKGTLFAEVKELLSSDRDATTYAELGRKLDMGEGALRMIVLRLRYQLLTGRPPFLADTLTQTLRLVTEAEIVSPRLLNPGVPRDLETICTKCLEKYPQRRYTSAQELAEELERFLHDEPIRARPVGPVGKVACWCRRKPALAAGITNSAELRREAFAALALPDLRFDRDLPYGEEFTMRNMDPAFVRIALGRGRGPVEIRSVPEDRLLLTLAASTNLPVYVAEWSADGRFLAVKRDYPGGGLRSDREIWDVPSASGATTHAR